ncbi:hypothetical protein A33_022684 [Vibrio cholerae AM-19226]|nr:hypothetical protein A33_022684 [Vibrio cholerae AM-19226]
MIEREIANVLVKHGAEQLHTHHNSATEDLFGAQAHQKANISAPKP